MFSRKLQWLSVGVFAMGAVFLAPSTSRADITIQVQEFNSTGNIGSALSFDLGSLSSNGTLNLPSGGSTLTTPSFTVGGTVTLGVDSAANAISLSTSLSLGITSSFPFGNSTEGLLVTITADSLPNTSPNAPASFSNDAGASNGLNGGGSVGVSGISTIDGVSTPASSTSSGTGPITTNNISNLPATFSIIQTLTINAVPVNTATTFTATSSTDVNTNFVPSAVPAPGGLALALVGLPLIGLRRVLRRKATAPTA